MRILSFILTAGIRVIGLIEKHGTDRYNEWNFTMPEDFYTQNRKAIKFRDTAL